MKLASSGVLFRAYLTEQIIWFRPAHYYYWFDYRPKYTKCELKTIPDVNVFLFIQRSIHGGMSQCSNRYGKVNNKLLKIIFNQQELITTIPQGAFECDIYFIDAIKCYTFGFSVSGFAPFLLQKSYRLR